MRDSSTDEAMAVHAILDRLASRGLVPEVHGMAGTFQLDIENVGRWYVTVDDRRLTISEGPAEADCALGCSAEDFIRMMDGELNPLTGFLRGRIRVAGDLAMAASFDHLLPVQR
jgi:putative sterol carrier protein